MMLFKVMFETDIHLRSLHTSIFNTYKVFEPLVCCLKGILLHPYSYTGKVASRFGDSVLEDFHKSLSSMCKFILGKTLTLIRLVGGLV